MTSLELDLETISDAELLARVVRTRTRCASVDALRAASALLASCGGLLDLRDIDGAELTEKLARADLTRAPNAASAIEESFELARRLALAERKPPSRLTGSGDVAAWATPRLGTLAHEELWMLALDGRGRLRAARLVARGGLHGAAVRAADPLRCALRASASGFVLVHNHPSGDATPSAHDIAFTREVAAAAAIVGVPLLDHVVVTKDEFSPVPFEGGAA